MISKTTCAAGSLNIPTHPEFLASRFVPVQKVDRLSDGLKRRLAQQDGAVPVRRSFDDMFRDDPVKPNRTEPDRTDSPKGIAPIISRTTLVLVWLAPVSRLLLGYSPLFGHTCLDRIDVQCPRSEVVDVRTFEGRDIRYKRMCGCEPVVHVILDEGVGLPLEGEESVVDQALRITVVQTSLSLGLVE